MNRHSILSVCLLALTLQTSEGELPATYKQKKQESQQASDAVWISIRVSRPAANNDSDFYFDLQRDGTILVLRQRVYFATKGERDLRLGVLSGSVAKRIFQIISAPSVLEARDTETSEQMDSTSDWVNVGARIGGQLKQAPLWGFTEEFKDYPAQFQQVIEELKRIAETLPQTTDVKKLIVASPVDDKRAQAIRDDPRRFFNIMNLSEKEAAELPAMSQAQRTPWRMIPIKNDDEVQRLLDLAKKASPRSTGGGFFLTIAEKAYEIRLY